MVSLLLRKASRDMTDEQEAFTAETALPPARSVLFKPAPKRCGPSREAASARKKTKIRSATEFADYFGEMGSHVRIRLGITEDHRGPVLSSCQQQVRGQRMPGTSRGV